MTYISGAVEDRGLSLYLFLNGICQCKSFICHVNHSLIKISLKDHLIFKQGKPGMPLQVEERVLYLCICSKHYFLQRS